MDTEADWLKADEPEMFRYVLEVGRSEPEHVDARDLESLLMSPATIRHEALYHFPKGRPRRLFERAEPGTPITSLRSWESVRVTIV